MLACLDRRGWGPFDASRFDFTPCFEVGVLEVIPCIYLLLFASIRHLQLRSRRAEEAATAGRTRYRAKAVTLAILILNAGLRASFVFEDGQGDASSEWLLAPPLVTLLAFAYAASLHHQEHRKTRIGSTCLLFFWLQELLYGAIRLRTMLADRAGESHSPGNAWPDILLLALQTGLALVIFTLECLGPKTRKEVEAGSDDPDIKECPITTANIFSKIAFEWMTPMMKLGKSKYLTEDDLWTLPEKDQVRQLGQVLQGSWNDELSKGKNPSLWLCIFRSYSAPFIVAVIFKIIQDALAFLQPQLLRRLLQFVDSYGTDGTPEPAFHGYLIAALMSLSALVQTAFLHQYFQRCFETGMRVRAGLVTAIYKKSLVLSNEERANRSTGDIVNLMSVDAARLQDLSIYGAMIVSGPLQILLAFVSLYNLIGWQSFVGVAVMVVAMPINTALARVQKNLQKRQMKNKDRRTGMMNEILSNIKSIKLYAWEKAFTKKLFAIRNDQELNMLRKMGIANAVSNFLWSSTPFFVSFATFITLAYTGDKPVTSQLIFPALTLFGLLQFPLAVIAGVITSLVESLVAVERLRSFLSAPELQSDARKLIIAPDSNVLTPDSEIIAIRAADFKWSSKQLTPTLEDITLLVQRNQLIAVVGQVGDGKSSLISAILGEMLRTEGEVTVRGTIAYVSQITWIMGGTVKDNILFGHRFDPDFYDIVLDACALRHDLSILPEGDMTEIGENGVSLSGGQRARISLARAVYARADIYLLDDPLSAVDAHVGHHLFEQVIGPRGLLSKKTRILATNAIAYVEEADQILMMRRGLILQKGTYTDVMSNKDSELCKLLTEFGRKGDSTESPEEDEVKGEITVGGQTEEAMSRSPDAFPTEESSSSRSERQISLKSKQIRMRRASQLSLDRVRKDTIRQMKESSNPKEDRQVGSVERSIYSSYLNACGIVGVTVYLTFLVSTQILQILSNVWLKDWGQRNTENGDNGNIAYYIWIYFGLGFGASLCTFMASMILWIFCVIRSARIMHDGMFNSVIRAPLTWFEQTPLGRILNLFSRDVYVIDELLARVFSSFFATVSRVCAVLVVICASTPPFIVAVVPLALLYRMILKYYLQTSRELKRLDAISRSPIFAWFQESLGGLTTIRAYQQTERFIASNEARVDRNQQAYFPSVSCNRWLAVRLEVLGSIIILTAASLAVFALVTYGNVDAGIIGLMMSYALSTTQALNWIIRSASEVEQNIVSVERVTKYTEVKSEAPLVIKQNRPDPSWPTKGRVRFDQYSTRYREGLPLVLKDVDIDILPREKIGVVGRTGAGKSSLTLALWRIIEPTKGRIWIDGVDITKIGLFDLRSRLSIIPQDPQLFEGTLRDNLDPEGIQDDIAIWKALENAAMKDVILKTDGKLDSNVVESGNNFSAGQRQLLCMTRALLRKSLILVLDEATSAVDPETDARLQKVLRSSFQNQTAIIIAHRLNTVMDCDRILVMDNGQVAEFDTPKALLDRPDSMFRAMAKDAGLV